MWLTIYAYNILAPKGTIFEEEKDRRKNRRRQFIEVFVSYY